MRIETEIKEKRIQKDYESIEMNWLHSFLKNNLTVLRKLYELCGNVLNNRITR
jgi:hypothetical protein